MKILYAITGYLPDVFGGAEVYTQRLARAVRERGHDVRVLTLDLARKNPGSNYEHDGVPVQRMTYNPEYRPAPIHATQFHAPMYDEAAARFASDRPDVVHVTNGWFMPGVAFAALDAGIPVLWTHVDFLWTCRGGKLLDARAHPCGAKPGAACASCYDDIDAERALVRQVREELVGAMARGVSLHHAPCPFMAEHVVGAGAPRDRVLTAPYGVPASMRAVEKTPSADGRLRLGFIGRWNRIKGLSVLLGAIERLGESAPVALTLYGEREVWNTDTYAMEIEARARRLANVRVAGRLDPSRLADAHRELDALVVPSVWAENSPVTILEALALGTPVVCSDEAGMTNLIRDGANGLVFSSGDAQALAEKLEILARDGDLRTHLRAGARCVRTVEEDAEEFERAYSLARPPDEAWKVSTRPLVRLLRYADEVQAAAGPRRRVLAAVKELAAAGCRRVALYGAGKHTMRVLGTCDFPGVDLVAILDDDPAACGGKILGIPVHPRDDAASLNLDAVIVSSDYHEAALLEKSASLRAQGIRVRALYADEGTDREVQMMNDDNGKTLLERDVTIRGTIVCGEEKQDVEIRFSAPARVVAGHWETTIEAPWLMRRIHPIGGVDARQSRELAVRFVLWMVEPDGKSIIIFNEDGEPVDFLEAVGIDGATTTTDA